MQAVTPFPTLYSLRIFTPVKPGRARVTHTNRKGVTYALTLLLAFL